jgi:hypothetical protein
MRLIVDGIENLVRVAAGTENIITFQTCRSLALNQTSG